MDGTILLVKIVLCKIHLYRMLIGVFVHLKLDRNAVISVPAAAEIQWMYSTWKTKRWNIKPTRTYTKLKNAHLMEYI